MMMGAIALTLLTTLATFADLLKLANTSKQSSLRFETQFCVLLPLIAAFVCQPKFISRVLNDRRLNRVAILDSLPGLSTDQKLLQGSLLVAQPVRTLHVGRGSQRDFVSHITAADWKADAKESYSILHPDTDSTESNTPQH